MKDIACRKRMPGYRKSRQIEPFIQVNQVWREHRLAKFREAVSHECLKTRTLPIASKSAGDKWNRDERPEVSGLFIEWFMTSPFQQNFLNEPVTLRSTTW